MNFFRILFSIIFFTALLSGQAQAQVPELINNRQFHPDAKAAVDSIYNFNFDGAQKELSDWREKYPGHPLWQLMKGMQYWWEVLSDLESTVHDDQLITQLKRANYEAGKLLHDQPSHADGLIIKAISNGYLARHHANRGNWITSMNYGRKAINAYQYLEEVKPGFADLKLAEGLKQYYIEYIPEAYPIVRTVAWAMPDGNKSKGLQLLREASRQAIFASAEATYFLGNINYNYEKEFDVAVKHFEELQSRYPNNNYYARILVKSYYKSGRYEEALSFIEETLKRWNNKELPNSEVLEEEFYTWKGRALEKQENKKQAIESYIKAFESSNSMPNSQNRSYYAASGYLAGKLLYEENRTEESSYYLKKVSRSKTDSGYKKRAETLLKKIN